MQENYPTHLIPTRDQLVIKNPNRDDHLGKWVESEIDLKDSDGKLNAGLIDIKRIPGFSTNKLPDSIVSDLNIKFKPEYQALYNTDWTEGSNGIVPENDHFEVITNRDYYFLKIDDIDNFTDEYLNPPDDKTNVYKFTVNVIHKPLVSNYWHFELEITSPDHSILNANSAWRKLICSSIRDRIQDKAVFSVKKHLK